MDTTTKNANQSDQNTDENANEHTENNLPNEQPIPVAETEQPSINPIELVQQELAIANDKYLRLYSEFDNVKKRTARERIELIKSAGADVITSLLPVLDDFDRAIRSFETTQDINAVKEGILLINTKLNNILTQKGLTPMNAKGTAFDADLHEAITNVPTENESEKGLVMDEVEKGYYLNDKVIRHAKVVVYN
ncbi:MAG: nucleotide exchange factor GrpE [Bacteroidetes bacterium]|nr:nucleotide exchange factor GrpE [Bacteroidota bacterium]HNU33799.1 nucleotide exchange factor GrpE [Bacteroidia bacterium]